MTEFQKKVVKRLTIIVVLLLITTSIEFSEAMLGFEGINLLD